MGWQDDHEQLIGKDFEGGGLGLFQSSIPTLTCRSQRKPQSEAKYSVTQLKFKVGTS